MESEFRFQWGSQKLEQKIGIPNQVEQQLNTATLSMSPGKWKQLVELQKQKWGEEEVVGAAEEVIDRVGSPMRLQDETLR
jgi:hypothetical protein